MHDCVKNEGLEIVGCPQSEDFNQTLQGGGGPENTTGIRHGRNKLLTSPKSTDMSPAF